MKAGLLGFPQCGKRTLFEMLTGRSPEGKPEHESLEGQAPIRDPRVDAIAALVQPEKMKYAENTFVLCPDVAEGDAARHWLEAARRCDLLCMVVRTFPAEHVYHPKGSVDAVRDRGSLETELLLADLELVEKRLERIAKERHGAKVPVPPVEERVLLRCKERIENNEPLRGMEAEEAELEALRNLGLLTLKPLVWVFNCAEDAVRTGGPGELYVAALLEKEIAEIADPAERREYLQGLGFELSGLDRMNAVLYDALGLMSFYTMGKDEVRAWTIRKGSPAPVAAGKIHSDIQRGFIRVEVVKYDDLVAAGSEEAVKQQGKAYVRGRDYVIEDGDICHFRFNV